MHSVDKFTARECTPKDRQTEQGTPCKNMVHKEKDYAISIIRMISTVMIVLCHMMQYEKMELAWWFNVGVQIFFCMSGYLYGKIYDHGKDQISFYKKQFSKILIDYYIVLIFFTAIKFILVPSQVSLERTAMGFLLCGTVKGGEHLWFIPYILLCYFLIPVLFKYFTRFQTDKSSGLSFILLSIVMIPLFFAYTSISPAKIWCFVFGLYLGVCERTGRNNVFKKFIFLVIAGCILSNLIQIICDYGLRLEFTGPLRRLYGIFCEYAHATLGCSLFFAMKRWFTRLHLTHPSNGALKQFCDISDRFSFDIYLVHQFFIIGPLSLMDITKFKSANIALIFVLILISAYALNQISGRVKKRVVR